MFVKLFQCNVFGAFAYLAYTLGVDMQMPELGIAVALPTMLSIIALKTR